MTYDCTDLEKLLANQEWKAADHKTLSMMLGIAGRTGWFDRSDLENFPCEELRAIDQLWVAEVAIVGAQGAGEQRSRGAEEQRSRGAEEQRSRGIGRKFCILHSKF